MYLFCCSFCCYFKVLSMNLVWNMACDPMINLLMVALNVCFILKSNSNLVLNFRLALNFGNKWISSFVIWTCWKWKWNCDLNYGTKLIWSNEIKTQTSQKYHNSSLLKKIKKKEHHGFLSKRLPHLNEWLMGNLSANSK